MNLLARIFTRSEPAVSQPLRHVVATRAESREAMAKRTDIERQLGVYNARTPRRQREAETAAYFAVSRALAPKAGRG